eukprot:gene44103-53916_t
MTLVGLALLLGHMSIVLLFGARLLPNRGSRGMPEDLSRHSGKLSEQYGLFEDLHQLEVTADSPFIGTPRAALELRLEGQNHPGLSLIAIRGPDRVGSLRHRPLAAGDTLIMRGEAPVVQEFVAENRLRQLKAERPGLQSALFNQNYGFIEVVLPPRSGLIGEAVFPGMITPSGDLVILGIQRRGEIQGPGQ